MNNTQLTINKAVRNKASQSLSAGLWLVTASFVLAATSVAAANDDTAQDYNKINTAYVDSVHKWGAWELDIEPAAGGLAQPTTHALKARGTKVTLRTNSISALEPQRRAVPAIPATPATPAVPATPSTPATPATPAMPAVTPISPSVPIPVGAP